MIRLSDIAQKLNVSTVTVSKALRNHPDISSARKKIILETAEKMGYMPNFMARNLSSKKSNTLGVVVPKIAHFFFGDIIESIYDYAFNKNYEIILMVSQENAKREQKHIQSLLSMRVDGIIISISQETKDYSIFKTVLNKGTPIVFMDRIPNLKNIDSVYCDDRGGSFRAVEHLINLGYKKIGHFAGYEDINIGKDRFLGFQEAMEQNNIPINPDWICHGGFGESAGYDSFKKLHRENNLPEVIFAVTYPVALGIYLAASEANITMTNNNVFTEQRFDDLFAANPDSVQKMPLFNKQFEDQITVADAVSEEELSFVKAPSLDSLVAELANYISGGTVWSNTGFITRTEVLPYNEVDMSYGTTANSYTAGIDGFPLGDLNWYPELKTVWEAGGTVEVESISNEIPNNYSLEQNYPNPFNPTTNIEFSVPFAGEYSLKVYNLLGQEVATLLNKQIEAGTYNVDFDASNLTSGVYVYTIK